MRGFAIDRWISLREQLKCLATGIALYIGPVYKRPQALFLMLGIVICVLDDLCRLSGRTQPTAVKKWLQGKGILYWLNADNKPVTTEKVLNESLMGDRKTEPIWDIGK